MRLTFCKNLAEKLTLHLSDCAPTQCHPSHSECGAKRISKHSSRAFHSTAKTSSTLPKSSYRTKKRPSSSSFIIFGRKRRKGYKFARGIDERQNERCTIPNPPTPASAITKMIKTSSPMTISTRSTRK